MDVTDLKEELLLLRKENAELRRTDSAETEGQGEIMTEQRRITDELRSGVANYPFRDNRDFALFEDIADRIDAEHEREISRAAQLLADAEKDRDLNYANWQDCKQKVLQHNITMDELSAEIERLKDELAYRINPPKDADGKYWFCGDKIMLPDGNVVEIIGIGGDWLYYCVASVAITVFGRIRAHDKRHYHAPTVEDVLREMLDKWGEMPSNMTNEAIVAEYAAKLQLKEGA